MNPLIIIPARGGSKGIPRKNVRPLCGRPLIAWSIESALACDHKPKVVVTTDDDEIALFAERFGAMVIRRPISLANDVTTLDPVIEHAVRELSKGSELFDPIITIQPTSPLVAPSDIDAAITLFETDDSIDTVVSVVDDRHLRWTTNEKAPTPLYKTRMNRQDLPSTWKETGAIIACRSRVLCTGTRFGESIKLLPIPSDRSIDIDTNTDFLLCEILLQRKRVVFVVIGNQSIGLGHVYRALILAGELVGCDIQFIVPNGHELAAIRLSQSHYAVHSCAWEEIPTVIDQFSPSIIVNDVLDTTSEYMESLLELKIPTVNFEDLGAGINLADLVINSLYEDNQDSENVLSGPKWFCLRDEFLHLSPSKEREGVHEALITFGGVDENNLTVRSIESLAPMLEQKNIHTTIVLGPGYSHQKTLQEAVDKFSSHLFEIIPSTSRISDYMARADIAITSGGRTVLELASLCVPTIVICQNKRETTHAFASEENGVSNLGLWDDTTCEKLLFSFAELATSEEKRIEIRRKLRGLDTVAGKQRVVSRLQRLMTSSRKVKKHVITN